MKNDRNVNILKSRGVSCKYGLVRAKTSALLQARLGQDLKQKIERKRYISQHKPITALNILLDTPSYTIVFKFINLSAVGVDKLKTFLGVNETVKFLSLTNMKSIAEQAGGEHDKIQFISSIDFSAAFLVDFSCEADYLVALQKCFLLEENKVDFAVGSIFSILFVKEKLNFIDFRYFVSIAGVDVENVREVYKKYVTKDALLRELTAMLMQHVELIPMILNHEINQVVTNTQIGPVLPEIRLF